MEKFAVTFFNDHAEDVAKQYMAMDRPRVHQDFISFFPQGSVLNILDIGAGSGADAAMFSDMGHHVIAAEPADKLRQIGEEVFSGKDIIWTNERLPAMGPVIRHAAPFDAILNGNVLQYLEEDERMQSLQQMFDILAPNGLIEFQYPTPASREGQFTVAQNEICDAVATFNNKSSNTALVFLLDNKIPDFNGRKALDGSDLFFRTVILRSQVK